MPTYEYMCEKCDHEFEREQRITDAPVKTCPECRSRRVKKLISRTSFVLKGGGWYSDLYSSAKKGSKGGRMTPTVNQNNLGVNGGWASVWFPLDLELEKKREGEDVEVQLVEKKNKLFGKIESDWKKAG